MLLIVGRAHGFSRLKLRPHLCGYLLHLYHDLEVFGLSIKPAEPIYPLHIFIDLVLGFYLGVRIFFAQSYALYKHCATLGICLDLL